MNSWIKNGMQFKVESPVYDTQLWQTGYVLYSQGIARLDSWSLVLNCVSLVLLWGH